MAGDDNGHIRKVLLATREMTMNIGGIEYDCILIPKEDLVTVDYSNFPEDDPLRRVLNIEKFTKTDLEFDEDIIDPFGGIHPECSFRLTPNGAKKLLESL